MRKLEILQFLFRIWDIFRTNFKINSKANIVIIEILGVVYFVKKKKKEINNILFIFLQRVNIFNLCGMVFIFK